MTSTSNYLSTSFSNSTIQIPSLGGTSLLSTQRFPTTFIVQPPSSSRTQTNTLLTKRYKPTELGDLLFKKIRTGTTNSSESNSPMFKQNDEDAVYDSCEAFEEVVSPSIKSFCDEEDKANIQRSCIESLIPQRSLSMPLVCNTFSFKSNKGSVNDSQKQVQNALESLQKKILLEQQSATLRDILLKLQSTQQPLTIPPLVSSPESTISSLKKDKEDDDDEPQIIYGEVEYPLLSLLVPRRANTEGAQISMSMNPPNTTSKRLFGKGRKSLAKLSSDDSSPASDFFRQGESLLESLTVTRAETQRSESEMISNLEEMSEQFAKITSGSKRRNKKADSIESFEIEEKGKKTQKKEKTTKRRQKKNEVESPAVKARKGAERRKNKWQDGNEINKVLESMSGNKDKFYQELMA